MKNKLIDRAVIKLSTDVCTTPEGHPHGKNMQALIEQIVAVKEKVRRVFLVASGAVAAGRADEGKIKSSDETADEKGVFASSGQPLMLEMYRKFLPNDWKVHQFLLTKENFSSQHRSETLLGRLRIISDDMEKRLPIFNENDPIANEEIMFTDNDELTGLLARLVHADIVILLTGGDIHGVQTNLRDPTTVIPTIALAEQELRRAHVVSGSSGNGRGGMLSKYETCCDLAKDRIPVHIANGSKAWESDVLRRILTEREQGIGTTFLTE